MKKLIDYGFWLLSRIDEPWYSLLNAFANWLKFLRTPEKVEHLGELNPERTFYMIRDFPDHIGLAGWYDRVLGYLARAEKCGWTPVIDCAEWGEYFSQPSEFSLGEVQKSARVVRAVDHAVVYKRVSRANVERRHRLAAKVPMNAATLAFCEAHRLKVLKDTKGPVVGVYFRGTDYRKTAEWNAIGHSTVPTFERFFAEFALRLRKWGLETPEIFVVTEEEAILNEFRHRYPNARFVAKPRFVNFNFGVCLPKQLPDGVTKRENNLLYLADLYILSKCDYLVGTMNGGIQLALNWNGNVYRDVAIFDFGTNRP